MLTLQMWLQCGERRATYALGGETRRELLGCWKLIWGEGLGRSVPAQVLRGSFRVYVFSEACFIALGGLQDGTISVLPDFRKVWYRQSSFGADAGSRNNPWTGKTSVLLVLPHLNVALARCQALFKPLKHLCEVLCQIQAEMRNHSKWTPTGLCCRNGTLQDSGGCRRAPIRLLPQNLGLMSAGLPGRNEMRALSGAQQGPRFREDGPEPHLTLAVSASITGCLLLQRCTCAWLRTQRSWRGPSGSWGSCGRAAALSPPLMHGLQLHLGPFTCLRD